MWKWEAKTEKKALQAPWVPRWVKEKHSTDNKPASPLLAKAKATYLADMSIILKLTVTIALAIKIY